MIMGSSNHRRTETGWIVLCFFVFATASYARSVPKDPAEKEKVAKNGLAGLLKKVSSYFSVKEARYPDSKKGGDSNFDRNSGNPGDSNTTYHSYVWDYCLKMTQGANCQKWLDPYVSQHGLDSGTDGQSPLESLVARLWKSMKKEGDDGKGGSYGIFDTQSRGGGTVLDVEGRLDRTRLTKFQLKGDVKKKVEQVGYESAAQTLSVTFNEDAPKNTMANIESLRLMAGRWTRMMRNRVVASLGELRANDKGTEFTLGEDMANCEDYLSALKQVPDNIERERIKFQGRLDPETFAADVRRRYQNCVQARNASVYMVNAKVNDGKVSAGNPNDEQIDKWKNRLNVAAIDYGGIDVNSLPKPSDQQLTESQTKSEIAEWKEGGTDMRVIRVSNGEQIESYNRQLRTAAQGMKEASVRSPFIPDTSDQILSRQIKPGSVSLVELNGLTPEMKNELKGTDAPGVAPVQSQANPNPDRNYEDTPSQLTISAAR